MNSWLLLNASYAGLIRFCNRRHFVRERNAVVGVDAGTGIRTANRARIPFQKKFCQRFEGDDVAFKNFHRWTSSRRNWFVRTGDVTFVEVVMVTFTYWSGGTPLDEDSETLAPVRFVTQPLAAV